MINKDLMKEKERILEKIRFYKKYITYLIRITIGSIITTAFFIYLMNAVNINFDTLSISKFSLIILALSPTAIPIIISYLFYKQLKELNKILFEINKKINVPDT